VSNHRLRIGLLLDFLFDEYQLKVWTGIVKATEDMDANLYCFPGGSLKSPFINSAQRNYIFNLALTSKLDGLVIMSAVLGNFISKEEFTNFYNSFKIIPNISIGTEIDKNPSIVIDNARGVMDIVTHLVEDHHLKRLAFIKGPDDNAEANARYSAYINALLQHNLAFDPELVAPGSFFIGSGEKAVSLFFDQRKIQCDAIIASNDLTAIDTLHALKKRGIRVPKDVALSGFDNIRESRFVNPQLTTVHQPFMELGYEAVKMLIAQIKGSEQPARKILPSYVRIRQSCGCSFESKYYTLFSSSKEKKPLTAQLLKNTKDRVVQEIKQAIKDYTIEIVNSSGKLTWIPNLVENFFKTLLEGEEDLFLNDLENTANNVDPDNIDIFNWCQILFLLCNALLPYLNMPKDFVRILNLWNRALEILLRLELKNEAEYTAETNRLFRVIGWIGQDLLATFNKQKFKQFVSSALEGIGIRRFYITEFVGEYQFAEDSYFIEAYEQGKTRNDLLNKDSLKTASIVISCSTGENRRECLIVLPLFVHQDILGLFLVEHSNLEGFVYEYLAVQLSNALRGVNFVDQLSQQTEILVTSNKEKEILLKEIHHRVKNNLQVIYSLLNLQCQQISNSDVTTHFKAIQNRIKSMALLHEHLYKSEDLTRINLKNYLGELIDSIRVSYSIDTAIYVELNSEDIYIAIEKAIPLGLVINELVSNSFKHAFRQKSDKESSKIEVICHSYKNNQIFLSVRDNGTGFPKDFNIRNTTSLGMQIVYSVIENQLDGHINLVDKKGSHFNMLIPL
jgi:two-component sensor histidine kinase/DNA-binding LacI/PurR family transcriptional regulator